MTTLKVQVSDDKKLKALVAFFKSLDMPCEIEKEEDIPNEETIQSIKDARNGKVNVYKSTEELFNKFR